MGFFERWRLNFLFLKDMFLTLDHGSTAKYIFQGIINISLITSWNIKKKVFILSSRMKFGTFYRVSFEWKKKVFKFFMSVSGIHHSLHKTRGSPKSLHKTQSLPSKLFAILIFTDISIKIHRFACINWGVRGIICPPVWIGPSSYTSD